MANSDNFSLQKYHKILSEANLKESSDPPKTLILISECIRIIDEDSTLQHLKISDLPILQKRKKFLETRNHIDKVYQNLKQNQNPSYEDYLLFYQQLNAIHLASFPPVIYRESKKIYYIGDTHGSYEESIMMIRHFEMVLSKDPSIRIVFLGDYVDRNPKDLENVTLIFGFYSKYRENVVILRGNHEDRTINEDYGFLNNLNASFKKSEQVESLYNEILKFFIKLPIIHVHVIPDIEQSKKIRIFAVHGGIPVDVENPNVPIDLHTVEKEIMTQKESYKEFDRYMNWLLWADPKEEISTIVYDPFTGRSQFGSVAFEQFLQKNQFDLMIRAHEKWTEGVKMYFNDKLISLFSTSYYNGIRIGTGKFLYIESGKPLHLIPLDEETIKHDLETFK